MENVNPSAARVYSIALGCVIVNVVIMEVTRMYGHWPFLILGIVVGLMAVSSIH